MGNYRVHINYFKQNWREIFVILWIILILAADLKITIHPRIHWFVTVILLLPIFRLGAFHGNQIKTSQALIPILFVLSVILSSFFSQRLFYGLAQSGKLAIILVWAGLSFMTIPLYAKQSFKAFILAACLNGAVLLVGAFISPLFIDVISGDGRWGTFLNYPGSLGKVGLLIFPYSLYMILSTKPIFNKYLFLLGVSLLTPYFDGSRTIAISLIIATFFVLIIRLLEAKSWETLRFIGVRSVSAVISMLLFWFVLIGALSSFSQALPKGFGRAEEVVTDMAERVDSNQTVTYIPWANSLLQIIKHIDGPRYGQIEAGILAIAASPIWGNGIGATKAETSIGEMVIHNTYLQVWADLGLFGIITYLLVVGGWLIHLPKTYKKIKVLKQANERGLYYCSMFLLFYFLFSGLFHPLSTEWSEWVIFLIPHALYREILQKDSLCTEV